MKNQRGFTLLELMVTVAVLGFAALLATFLITRVVSTGGGTNQEEAERQAHTWATHMQLRNASVSCGAATVGPNAMVPCTVSVPTKGEVPAIYGLECGAAFRAQEGCRVRSTPLMPGQQ